MHKIFANSLVIGLIFSSSVIATENDDKSLQQRYLQESRQIAKAFMQSLGSTLKAQLESDNTVNAISVCKHVAPAIAADYSNEDLMVTRVSLKNRNPVLGKPDAWEKQVLERFDLERAEAKPVNEMEISDVTEESDGRWFRYMKAIPTQAMCLQCHGKGDSIPPEVKALLDQEYPADQAIGYDVGDIRGAVSIKHKLPE